MQLTISPLSKAEQREVFDFEGDAPDYIFSGESSGDGRENGNCIGAGCDDISPEDSGQGEWSESPDRDENGSNDYDHNENQNDRDFDHSNDPGIDFTHKTNERPRQIVTFDRDRGDGVIYIRDEKGKNYYRGPPSELVKDEQGDFYSPDNTDIYFDDKDQKYVKSDDGKSLINLNNLLQCAPSFDCESLGFREDWWNYSMGPEIDNGDEANEWSNLEHFSKKQFQIKNGIDKAWDESSISRSPDKAAVLQTAAFLYNEAKSAYEKSFHIEAYALQDGAAHLTSLVADIGLGLSPIGWAKDAYELITGKGFVDGRTLTANERIFAGLGVIANTAGPLGIAGIKLINRGIDAGRSAGVFDKIAKLAEKVVVQTPFGPAVQDMSKAALEVKASITAETKLYRTGTMGKSMTGEKAQFWALEHPQSPGYTSKFGIPDINVAKPDFIEVGRIKEGVPFVTRPAPSVGKNGGGAIEVVVPEGGISLDGHYTP